MGLPQKNQKNLNKKSFEKHSKYSGFLKDADNMLMTGLHLKLCFENRKLVGPP